MIELLVTSMCLLFDKVWLPNHIDLIIEYINKFRLKLKYQMVYRYISLQTCH